jgi:hypothetical protein
MAIEGIGKEKIVSIETLRQLRATRAAREAEKTFPAASNQAAGPEDAAAVRRDKVLEAKQRITSGYYDRPEVRREILRSFLSSMLPPPSGDTKPEQGADPGGTQPEEPTP